MSWKRTLPALTVAAALLPGATAQAAAKGDLWATVNVCDVSKKPNRMGVRARMPGNGTRARMYMRFTAQYRSGSSWKQVAGHGVSRWLYAGSALFSAEELGYTFSFDAPVAGDRFVFRGVTDFQWRARRRRHGRVTVAVVRRERLVTEAGHPSTGAEPAGYSAATCEIDGPAG